MLLIQVARQPWLRGEGVGIQASGSRVELLAWLLAEGCQGDGLLGVGGRRLAWEDGGQLLVQHDQAVALLQLSQGHRAERGIRGEQCQGALVGRARRLHQPMETC
jgi:hypothetical protein